MIELLGISIGQQSLVIGLVTGLTYAAFAAGFVLIYRSTGVLNFAHGEVGAFGVALFVLLLAQYGLNWWLSFVLALAACAAMGMSIELIVIRRLFASPRLVVLIATIGVGQIVAFAKISLPAVVTPGPIPSPFQATWTPTDHIRVQAREIVVLVVVPVLIAALAWFIARTRFGLAVRASASNPDTARVYGTSPRRTSTIVWTIAGAFAASTAIFLAPLQGINSARAGTAALAEPLLLRVLVVSLLARMRSLPLTLAGGVVVGRGRAAHPQQRRLGQPLGGGRLPVPGGAGGGAGGGPQLRPAGVLVAGAQSEGRSEPPRVALVDGSAASTPWGSWCCSASSWSSV